MLEITDCLTLEGTFLAHFGVFGPPGNNNHPLGPRCNLGSILSGCPREKGVLFWSTFAHFLANGRLMLHFSSFFLRYAFEARFFIDFGWPEGSKIDAFGGWRTWLKCGK